jgi:hypothetical protein
MKKLIFTSLILTLVLISCKKPVVIDDYRNEVIGEYEGFKVSTYYVNPTVGYASDTLPETYIISITKSTMDSIVEAHFNPSYYFQEYSFKFLDGKFFPTTTYHPPVLKIIGDSLYYKHAAGNGPNHVEFFAHKKH